MSCQYGAKTGVQRRSEILGLFDIERTAGATPKSALPFGSPSIRGDRWIVAIDSAREQFQIARGRRDSGQ
jgi:hypothetical protein